MTDADSELHEPLGYILSLSEAGLTEMRSLIFELRPESLAIEGLVAALTNRVDVLRVRHHLIVEADLGVEPDVELSLKETLYRIAQEALHNTVKHARAHYAWLTLTDTGAALELEIRDDGTGFDQDAPRPGGLGLRSMRERVAAHGGAIEIASRPGAGTVIRAQLPRRGA
jgi:signal transduction histidine kinase